jgi:acyl-CoA reductase-like NAD-dependent aldehyde dehydrogenase
MRTLQNYIDGAWVDGASADRLTAVNPATEEPIALLPAGSEQDVDAAVDAARRAAEKWEALPLEERLAIVGRAADVFEAHIDELAELEAIEMGHPPSVATPWLVNVVARLRGEIELARGYEFVREDETNTVIERRPVGVVAVITPWNFPTWVIIAGIGPALVTGNTVVVKPSEKAPLSAVRVFEILADVFPKGVINLVLGDVRAGAPLSAHPGIGLTNFTGSVRAGKAIAAASAANLRRVILELGGKDPVIVDTGVDLAAAAKDIARGAFSNTGQICTSMERIYVHKEVADDFLEKLLTEARAYTYGDPLATDAPMGPLVDGGQRDIVISHVDDAVRRGAQVVLGGVVPDEKGYYYPATVLTGVTDDMLIMREETFGPIAPIQVVESFEEALAKAKGTDFGLAATVYSNDPEHVRAARSIPAAVVWINRWQGGGTGVVSEPAGHSGVAVMGGVATLDAHTRPSATLHNALAPA